MGKLIIANWKSNPATLADAVRLAEQVERAACSVTAHSHGAKMPRGIEVVVAPPFPFLARIHEVIKKACLGAQDAFWEDVGPFTGAVSWRQLKSLGVRSVIVGHSERRMHMDETDEMVNKKVRAVLEHGLQSVLCVGEWERAGTDIPPQVGIQLTKALAGVEKSLLKNLVVAYEPVWAISTMPGNRGPDTPDSAFRARIYLEKVLGDCYGRTAATQVRIIYGGSVNAANVVSFLTDGKMDGALVGGASLNSRELGAIVRAAAAI